MWLLYPQKPEAVMPLKAGYEEDGFLQALGVTPEELEPLADNCTQVKLYTDRQLYTGTVVCAYQLEPLADNCTQVQSYTDRQLYTGTVVHWQTTAHRYSRTLADNCTQVQPYTGRQLYTGTAVCVYQQEPLANNCRQVYGCDFALLG